MPGFEKVEYDPFAPSAPADGARAPVAVGTRPTPANPAAAPKLERVDYDPFASVGGRPAPASEDGDFVRGLKRTLPELKQLAGGTMAAIGDVTGWDGLRDKGLEIYQGQEKVIEPLQKPTDSASEAWKRVKAGDLGAGADFLQNAAGYTAGQALESLATAGAGAAIGAAVTPEVGGAGAIPGAIGGFIGKQAVKRGVKEAAEALIEKRVGEGVAKQIAEREGAEYVAANTTKKALADQVGQRYTQAQLRKIGGAAAGGAIGAQGLNSVMEVGSVYPEALQGAKAEGRDLTGGEKARALTASLGAAGLESVADLFNLGVLFRGVKGAAGEAARTTLKQALTAYGKRAAVAGTEGALREAGTEGAQTFLERVGANQSLDDANAWRDYIDSAAVGAVGGVLFGAGAALHEQKADKKQPPPKVPFGEDPADQLRADVLQASTPEDRDAAHARLVDYLASNGRLIGRDQSTVTVGPDGTAMTGSQRDQVARAESDRQATQIETGLTPDVRAAQQEHPAFTRPTPQVPFPEAETPEAVGTIANAANALPPRPTGRVLNQGMLERQLAEQKDAQQRRDEAAAAPSNLPWFNSATGELGEPTDEQLHQFVHDTLNQQAAGHGIDRKAIERTLWNSSRVPPERLGEVWKQVTAERKTGLTAPAAKPDAAPVQGALDVRPVPTPAAPQPATPAAPRAAAAPSGATKAQAAPAASEAATEPASANVAAPQGQGVVKPVQPAEGEFQPAHKPTPTLEFLKTAPVGHVATIENPEVGSPDADGAVRWKKQESGDWSDGKSTVTSEYLAKATTAGVSQDVLDAASGKNDGRLTAKPGTVAIEGGRPKPQPLSAEGLRAKSQGASVPINGVPWTRLAGREGMWSDGKSVVSSDELAGKIAQTQNVIEGTATRVEKAAPLQLTPPAGALDAAAHEAATSPKNDLPTPTDAQKEAGNYAKGHVRIGTLDISIENPAGSKRRPEWPALKHHYGYIKGSIGKDKDHVDVFLTKNAADTSLPVFVVDQRVGDKFDEHKVILGAKTEAQAKRAYNANYSKGWNGAAAITQMTHAEFEAWVRNPDKTNRPAIQSRPTLAAHMKQDLPTRVDVAAVRVNGKAYPVAGVADARAKYDQVRAEADIGARRTPLVELLDPQGKAIGHLSYNGRAWLGAPGPNTLPEIRDDGTVAHRSASDDIAPAKDLPQTTEPAAKASAEPGGKGAALANATAPEHVAPAQQGVTVDELKEMAASFRSAIDAGGDAEVTHIFDAPAKQDIVRLEQKAGITSTTAPDPKNPAKKIKVYHRAAGWMTVEQAKAKIDEWEANALKQGRDDKMRAANSQKVVLSLFDLTGSWSLPWEQAGYQVFRFDIQDESTYEDPETGEERKVGDVRNMSVEFFNDLFGSFDGMDVHAILAACPCTDFAVSGAKHFAAKDADGRTVSSVELVQQTLAAIEYFKPAVWALENPVGRIEELTGLPPWRLSFDPFTLGDDYTKKTLIWGRFNADLPVAPVSPNIADGGRGGIIHSNYGGKSQATKNARSATPEGFAYAFFQANNAIDNPLLAVSGKYDRLDRDKIAAALAKGITEDEIQAAVDEFYYTELDDDAANRALDYLAKNGYPAAATGNLGYKFWERFSSKAQPQTAEPDTAEPEARSPKKPKTAPKKGKPLPAKPEVEAPRNGVEHVLKKAVRPFEKGQRVIVEPWSGERGYVQAVYPAGKPNAGPTFVDVAKLSEALGVEAPPRPLTAAQEKQAAKAKTAEEKAEAKASAATLQADTYRDLLADPEAIGKSLPDLTALVRARLDGSDTPNGKIQQLARLLHKEVAKKAGETEKNRHRDPQTLAAAIADAAAGTAHNEGAAREAFGAGFAHALAGKTKSTMVGDDLAAKLDGYAAARKWMRTETGAAYYEGRPAKKLENTGADLRRWYEQLRRDADAAKSDGTKLWAAMKKATTRADLFPITPLPGASPGVTRGLEHARENMVTFVQYLAKWAQSDDNPFRTSSSGARPIFSSRRYRRGQSPDEAARSFLEGLVREDSREHIALPDAPQSEWIPDPNDYGRTGRKIPPTRALKPGEAREILTNVARTYIREVQQLHNALRGANTAQELVEMASEFKASEPEAYEHLFSDHARWRGHSFNDPLEAREYTKMAYIVRGDDNPLPSAADRTKPLAPPRLDRVDRSGLPQRREGDITPAKFVSTFGFADVGFGKWVAARADQDHLNYAFDAFMDLAHHFGLPPKAVGFGDMHFTIGALGHGKWAAHFAPAQPHPSGGTVPVINVTNTKGDGTVYHEWGHAFDMHGAGGDWQKVRKRILDTLKKKPRTAQSVDDRVRGFLLGQQSWSGSSKRYTPVQAAQEALTDYQFNRYSDKTSYFIEAQKLDGSNKKDPYWSNDRELFARAIEAWAGDTLGGTNTYLVNPGWSGEGMRSKQQGYRGTPYPEKEERALFAKALDALRKATSYQDGKVTVSLEAFEKHFPDPNAAAEARRKELQVTANMEALREQILADIAVKNEAQQQEAKAKADAERAEADRLAAAALAQLEASAPTPPAGDTMGPLSDADLEAIFDEASAELRESQQEQPKAVAPGAEVEKLAKQARTSLPQQSDSPTKSDRARVQSDAQEKTAAALAKEAAKLGVEGVGEAMQGLVKLFGGGPGRLNSFPSGFDEDAYKAAKPHFDAALKAFQAAGKTLKDLFRFLIEHFGEGIKQYAVRYAKEQGLGAQLGEQGQASASGTVADWVHGELAAGRAIDWRALFGQADTAFGGTQAEGRYTPKDAYDALEAGVNRYIMANPSTFDPQANAEGAIAAIGRLEALTQLLPTQTKRTPEQDEFQQFSTIPAAAYAANWVASVSAADTLLEPSAGIGGLAVFAKNAGAKLVLNELSSRRAAVLQEVFPTARVFHENAEQIDNILPDDVTPSVVVMNPPFSASAGRVQGLRDTSIGAQHVEQALYRLAPGGRLVAIVGDGMRLESPAFRKWWAKIQEKHTVRAVVPMSGKGYAKYGTTFDNVLLVIDKTAEKDRVAPITTPIQSYNQLVGLLSEIRNDRPAASVVAEPAQSLERDRAEQARRDAAAAESGRRTGAGEPAGVGVPEPGAKPAVGAASGRSRGEGGARGPGGAVRGPRDRGVEADAGAGQGRSGNDSAAAGGGPDSGAGNATGVRIAATEAAPAAELTDSVFEGYQPQRLQVPGAQPHPGPLVQSAAMASVPPPAPTYTPNLPKATIEKGLLSLAQLETVVYAGQAHEQILPSGERRGFFIGDGTGVGKGREISGIILDNLRQGRKRAVWVSEKQDLMTDAKRDLKGVGGDDSVIFNQNKTKADGAIDAGDGVLFTTYATLRSGAVGQKKKGDAGDAAKKTGQTRLDQLAAWLGPDFDGVLVFDEAHNAGNAVAVKGKRGTAKPSEQAQAVVELQKKVPKARVVYVSATGATEVANLSFATRLGVWGEGTDFPDVHSFINEMAAGGLANMELVARDLKQMGAYIARSLSFEGVTYSRLEHELSPLQRDIYDRLAEAWQVTLQNIEKALELTGATGANGQTKNSRAVAAAKSAYWGGQQRFFNQIITSMQMPAVLAQMEADIAAGHALVLQLVNTNEAAQERALGKTQGEDDAIEDLDLTPRDQLIQMVEKSFPTVQMHDVMDGDKVVSVPVTDASGMPVENKEAVRLRDALLQDLRDIRVPDGPLEIVLNHFGPSVVGEVTGRGRRVVVKPDADGKVGPQIEKRGSSAARADAEAFMADKKRALIFSDAGGTGFSFHADRTKANQRKRMHYLIQPGWRANKAVQGFGRTHRTNQASAPHYYLAATNIPAHKRFLSSIARRLDQLGALTKGQRDTANQGLFSEKDNLESIYATQAVRQLMEDGLRGALGGSWPTFEPGQEVESEQSTGQVIKRVVVRDDGGDKVIVSNPDGKPSFHGAPTEFPIAKSSVRGAKQRGGLPFMDMLRQMGLEGIIDKDTGTIGENKMPPVSQFLNRMLSLKLDMQDQVFDAFMVRMEQKIEGAIARGEFDAGMQTIKAIETRIEQEETIHTDPRTGAETQFVQLHLEVPNRFYDFPKASRYADAEWVVNEKTGKVFLKVKNGTTTLKSGAVEDHYQLRGTSGMQSKDRSQLYSRTNDLVGYKVVDEAAARALWEQENAARPPTVGRTVHMVTGAVLPIWGRLKAENQRIEVVRTQTKEGRRLLGRLIPNADVAEVRKRFSISSTAAGLSPLEVMKQVLAGNTAELANGWKLERARVSDEIRVELKNLGYVTPSLVTELEKAGVIQERINWSTRFFVPIGAEGPKALAKLFENRPVVDITDPNAGDEAPQFSRRANGQFRGGIALERAEQLTKQLTARWGDNAPRIVLVQSAQELQQAARLPESVLEDPAFYRSEGLYRGAPTVWLNIAAIKDEQRLAEVLAHEALGHFGVERVLGKHEWKGIADAIDRHRREGTGAKDVRAAIAQVLKDQPAAASDREAFAKEVIAVMAEHGARNGLMQRVVAAALRFLRKLMPARAWSQTEIRDLLGQADSFLRRGRDQGMASPSFSPAFSKRGEASTFFSALLQAIETGKGAPKRAQVGTWRGWLDGAQRRGEFKQAERNWLGIDDWLAKQGGSVTRDQLAAFVRANQVQVKAVVLGDGATDDEVREWHDISKGFWNGLSDLERNTLRREFVREEGRDIQAGNPTKFDKYQLPGGANYRELLLTLDRESRTQSGYIQVRESEDADADEILDDLMTELGAAGLEDLQYGAVRDENRMEFAGWAPSDVARLRGFVEQLGIPPSDFVVTDDTAAPAPDAYTTNHFPEHHNILAHVRLNERADADGKKVLFIEEIQSDWHQQGRRRGYAGDEQAKVDAAVREYEQLMQRMTAVGLARMSAEDRARIEELRPIVRGQGHGSSTVPDAPFKGTDEWAMLAFKQMVRFAAEQGFDRIAWTTGEQQVDRYDLSKEIKTLTAAKLHDGDYAINAFDHRGHAIPGLRNKRVKESGLEALVGKDLAEKIIKGEGGTLDPRTKDRAYTNLDLKVGGEGMRGFYDKILPAAVNKWAKRFGAKVGGGNIGLEKSYRFAIHAKGASEPHSLYKTRAEAEADLKRFADPSLLEIKPYADPGVPAHSIDVTPAMREAALAGQPLFSLGENNGSGDSSASLEAIGRLRDERAAGQFRAVIDRDGTVRPLFGVDAVDTHARAGQIVVQRGIGRDEWTVLSQGADVSRDLAAGRLNRARPELADLVAEESEPVALFSRAPEEAIDAIETEIRQVDNEVQGDTSILGRARALLQSAVPKKLKDATRGSWLGGLTLRHLVELGSDYFPTMKIYGDYQKEMEADRNQLQQEGEHVAEAARKWAGKNLPEAGRMFDLMHDATILGVDPAEEYKPLQFRYSGQLREVNKKNVKEAVDAIREQARGRAGDNKTDLFAEAKGLKAMLAAEPKRKASYPGLVARWNQLSPEAKDHYVAMRDLYAKRSREVEEGLVQRIRDLRMEGGENHKRLLINRIRQQFESQRLQGVYFPLQRFGKFFVAAEKGDTPTFQMFESLNDLEKAVKGLRARGFTIKAQGLKQESKSKDAPSGSFVAEVITQLKKAGVSDKTQDEIYQLYLQALPELSMRKHSIHRKAVIGFDPDALRAFAFNMTHGAHQLARLRYAHKLADTIDVLQGQQDAGRTGAEADTRKVAAGDAVLEELRKRHEWISNPTDSNATNLVSSFGFSYYLGTTPAAAIVNLTQTALISFPFLASRYGAVKAMNSLLSTMTASARTLGHIQRTLTDPDEIRAHSVLQKMGAIDKTQTHNLAGIAEGGLTGHNPKWAKAMEIIGWGFHKTEVINREATGIAAFRLARSEGKTFDEAVKFAADAILDTHYDYSNANRARFMQSGAAKVLLMFRQYSLNTTWHLGRMVWNATKGADPDVKRIARRNLVGVLGMSALFSGVLGLPLMSVTMGVLNAIAASAGDDDEPWDAETEFRAFLNDMFGPGPANVILGGAVNPLTGADFASRVSLSQLWFRDADRELDGEGAYYNLLEIAAGPMGGVLKNALVGKQLIDEGHLQRGVETMLPKALKDGLKATRYATEGVNNLRGDPIVEDLSLRQVLLQLGGFTPSQVAEQYDRNRALKNYEHAILERRQRLMDAYAMAVRTGDVDGRRDAQEKIREFSRKYREIAITPAALRKSLKARARYSKQAEGGIFLNPKIAARVRAAVDGGDE